MFFRSPLCQFQVQKNCEPNQTRTKKISKPMIQFFKLNQFSYPKSFAHSNSRNQYQIASTGYRVRPWCAARQQRPFTFWRGKLVLCTAGQHRTSEIGGTSVTGTSLWWPFHLSALYHWIHSIDAQLPIRPSTFHSGEKPVFNYVLVVIN